MIQKSNPKNESAPSKAIEIFGLALPEVNPGDDLSRLLAESARSSTCGDISEGDVLVVTSKIVSNSAGLLIDISKVDASARANRNARVVGGDPRKIQITLDHSDKVILAFPVQELRDRGMLELEKFGDQANETNAALERNPSMLLVERSGQIYCDAGLDFSNHPSGIGSVPPIDPNLTAKELRDAIQHSTGVENLAVLISDTELCLAGGSMDVARGASGMQVIDHGMGRTDRFGNPKFGGMDNHAQECAAAASLLMGQAAEGIPAVLIRAVGFHPSETNGVGGWTSKPSAVKSLMFTVLKRTIQALGLRTVFRSLFRSG